MNRNPIDELQLESIPEVTIQLFKFKLFDKEVFAILEAQSQYEPFKIFIDKLNNLQNFETCKLELFQEIVKKRYPGFNMQSTKDKNFIKNYLGTQFFEMLQKIEDEYQIILREHKINQITND